jgi:hypothetical protein
MVAHGADDSAALRASPASKGSRVARSARGRVVSVGR